MLKLSRLPRRGFLSGLGLVASTAPSLAATPFTTFAFTATGEPTARTMPDRLAEIKNVVDFGADQTGVSDSQPAVQAAVNSLSGANRGTIYFPPGKYLLNSAVTYNYNGNLSICFRGEGDASIITGSFNGYLFDRSNVNSGSPNNTIGGRIFEKLNMQNSNTSGGGCIRMGSTNGGVIRDCVLRGFTAVTTEDSAGNSSQNIAFDNVQITGAQVPGCNGWVIGGAGVMRNCSATGCDTTIRLYGNGFNASGNRFERNNTVFLLGVDSGGTNQGATGFSLVSGTLEGNWTAFDFSGTCSGFFIGSWLGQGHDGTNAGLGTLAVTSYTYNSGTGLVTLTMTNTIPEVLVSGIKLLMAGLNIAGLNGTFNCASASGTTVTYTGPTGQAGSPSGGGTIALGSQYGVRMRAGNASAGVFSSLGLGSYADIAIFSLGNASSRANILFVGCAPNESGGNGVNWITPTNAYTAQFQNCNVQPVWTFSELPTGGNVLEGDEFSISDPNSNTWGANVTASGSSGHVLVRWNGTNWTVVGK